MKTQQARKVAFDIPGYTYGTLEVERSPLSLQDLEFLKKSVDFKSEDEEYLRRAGEILADQTDELVKTWRAVIAANPHLAQYSLDTDGKPDPHYSAGSGLRFRQWILDTCFRAYDQDWLNYQREIGLRHTSLKKNQTDHVESAPYIPLRYVVAFAAVINDTIKPFLAAKSPSAEETEKMHRAWCKSVQLQIALWTEPYMGNNLSKEW